MIDVGAVLAWAGAASFRGEDPVRSEATPGASRTEDDNGLPRLRDLPWRATRDPWRVLVAEVMLQQTQVERVIPKWSAFVATYPTPAECAAAPLGDVLRLWQGLGYPRRRGTCATRRRRWSRATTVQCPTTWTRCGHCPESARTPRAPCSAFAFERDVAVVDTNIARVLARAGGERLTPKTVQATADELVPVGMGWAWNQALMDLGAMLCRPVPRCGECPIAAGCEWRGDANRPPDPAAGSASVSTAQGRFEGSDRQARGQVLSALTRGPAAVSAFDRRIVDDLVGDRLVEIDGPRSACPRAAVSTLGAAGPRLGTRRGRRDPEQDLAQLLVLGPQQLPDSARLAALDVEHVDDLVPERLHLRRVQEDDVEIAVRAHHPLA